MGEGCMTRLVDRDGGSIERVDLLDLILGPVSGGLRGSRSSSRGQREAKR